MLTACLACVRRGLPGDVHDRGPEEVLRRHEEDGQEEAGQGHPPAEGRSHRINTEEQAKVVAPGWGTDLNAQIISKDDLKKTSWKNIHFVGWWFGMA